MVASSPACSDQPSSQPGEVALQAASYAWVCPKCDQRNENAPLARRVACIKCGCSFTILGTRDEFPVSDNARGSMPTARNVEIQAGLAIYNAIRERWPAVPANCIFLTATTVLASPPASGGEVSVWATRVVEVWEEIPDDGEYGPHYVATTWGPPCRCRETRIHGPYERERAAQERRLMVQAQIGQGYQGWDDALRSRGLA